MRAHRRWRGAGVGQAQEDAEMLGMAEGAHTTRARRVEGHGQRGVAVSSSFCFHCCCCCFGFIVQMRKLNMNTADPERHSYSVVELEPCPASRSCTSQLTMLPF